MKIKSVTVKQIKVGDVIVVWWAPGRDTITGLKPYTGPLLDALGKGTMIAEFAQNKTGMTMDTHSRYNKIVI
jgi:hypothetical protein